MWIKDEFDRGTLVEILVAGWRVLQRDHFGVYDLCNWQAVVPNRLHQLAIVSQNRRLAGVERM